MANEILIGSCKIPYKKLYDIINCEIEEHLRKIGQTLHKSLIYIY